jgi:dolichol-phosphate mannosyltransferase
VGVLGFAVQVGLLSLLVHAGLHYLLATVLAVEAAILHNFAWHERWTWIDRPAAGRARIARLWRFHALNGVVSLAGNLLLMRALVGTAAMRPLAANLVAALACAVVNFLAAGRLVFPRDSHKMRASGYREEASRCVEW